MERPKTLRRVAATAAGLVAAAGLATATAGTATAQPAGTAPSASTHAALAKKDYCGGSGPSKHVPDHWFKANFGPACQSHDVCYSRDSTTDRLTCDKNLLTDLRSQCMLVYPSGAKGKACFAAAKTYYVAVRKAAKSYYHGSGDPD